MTNLRLIYLPANAAYAFALGDQLLRMGDGPLFFDHRSGAASAAFDCGLQVLPNGHVCRLDDAEDEMTAYYA